MRTLVLAVAAVIVTSPALAGRETAGATCEAKYYRQLVGQGLDEARHIEGSDYRVLAMGAPRGVANPKRMTITFDPSSNRIVAVDCG